MYIVILNVDIVSIMKEMIIEDENKMSCIILSYPC